MLLVNIFLIIALAMIQFCSCDGKDIQYSFKVMSDTKGDDFGESLTTAHQRLLIGAPRGNYILPEKGVKVRAPQGSFFGERLDMNENFMVVSGRSPHSLYVYSSTHPHSLVARIPLNDEVIDVKVLDDNSIIVATDDGLVSIYGYTRHSTWDKQQEFVLGADMSTPPHYVSLAVSGNLDPRIPGHVLFAGYHARQSGHVKIYIKVNDHYIFVTTLQPPEHVVWFGWSVAAEGQHLVVSSHKGYEIENSILFTYKFDPSGGNWVMNGRLSVRNPFPLVSLKNGFLAATVNDRRNNPEVCAYVYNNHPDNKKISSVSNKTEFKWKKVATLKTNGVPMTRDQVHIAISVQDGLIVTGRSDYGDHYGMVLVHDLNKQ